MFKRFDNRQLMISMGALAVLYLLTMAFGGTADRTFKKTLVSIDTAAVSSILINPPGKGEVKTDQSRSKLAGIPTSRRGGTYR